MSERERILERIRRRRRGTPRLIDGPNPCAADRAADLAGRVATLETMAGPRGTEVHRIGKLAALPRLIAEFLAATEQPLAVRTARHERFAELDWAGHSIAASPAGDEPDEEAATLTWALCAIAETGSFIHFSGATAPAFLAVTGRAHFAALATERVLASIEDGFALLRDAGLPRLASLISGVSATGDFGSVAVRPGQGPASVHLVLVDDLGLVDGLV